MMRKSLIGVALALLVMLLNGCMSPDKKEITVMWWGDVYNARFAQKLVDAYNADHPAMPAKLITTSGNYASKLLTMAASETLPDVILMVTRDVHNLGSRGALLSLNQYESTLGFPDKQAMWDDLLDDVKQKGKLLAFPIWTWTPGIYYNKDLFDKADVAYPTDNWTWAEFAEKSIKLTKKKNGKTTQYALDMAGNLDHSFFLSYIYGHGGKVYSDDLTKCEIASPQTLAALKLFFELKLKHGIAPTSAEQASLATGGTLADYFQAGKTAMRCAGRDYMDVLRQGKGVSFRWGVAPMPSGSKKFFFRRISSLAIAKQSKHPDEAIPIGLPISDPLSARAIVRLSWVEILTEYAGAVQLTNKGINAYKESQRIALIYFAISIHLPIFHLLSLESGIIKYQMPEISWVVKGITDK
jgi:multiple sugar transport system substrate-binding protein